MIAPLACASAARQATAMRMVPVRLMSTTRANSAGSYSSRNLSTPAALTSTATASTVAANAVTAVESVMSSLVTPSAAVRSTPMVW
jgi:hypothetical protein